MLDRLNVSTVTGVITQVVTFLMQLRRAGVEIMGSFNKGVVQCCSSRYEGSLGRLGLSDFGALLSVAKRCSGSTYCSSFTSHPSPFSSYCTRLVSYHIVV